MSMKAWKVNLNDCDMEYVLAESEGVAVSLAIIDACCRSGFGPIDLMGDEGVASVERRDDLDGEYLTLRQLVAVGDCVNGDDLAEAELDASQTCIFLSTEY